MGQVLAGCAARDGVDLPGPLRPVDGGHVAKVGDARVSVREESARARVDVRNGDHLTLDDRFVGDGVLTEGIANWGGGQAVLRWQGFSDWPDAVRGYWRQGRYVPITDASALQPRGADDCIARRDRVYNIRTAFVGWLIARIGLARVLAMPAATVTWTDPASGERRQQILPDYELATGSSLGQLERQFLRSLGLGGPEVVMFQLRLELQGVDVQ